LTITVPGFLIAALVGGISLTRAGGGLFGIPRSATVLLCAGLALPCVVVVAFIGRTLRYQIYFLPLLIVLSMAALSYVKKGEVLGRPIVGRTVLVVFGALFVYSACASHLVNVDVKLRGLGSAEDLKARTAEYVRSYLSGIERIAGVLGSDDQAMKDGLDALYGRGDAPHAARLFRRILERNPKHYGATYQLAVALDRAGDPAGARVYWERMLAMAEAARDEAMVAGVRARLGRAPTLEERQADAMKAGLEALYTKNDPVAAALHFRKVLSMSPGHYGATYQLAAALDRAGRREEATFFWEKVLEMAGKYHDGATMQTARSRLGKSP
jgi:tetratricopeptide (TPR) repeat protein